MIVKIDKVKIPVEIYRYIEHELYHYTEYKKQLAGQNIDGLRARQIGEKISGGGFADPTYYQSLHLCKQKRFLLLAQNSQALERTLQNASPDLQEIFRLQYCKKMSWQKVAMQLHLEQATYYRRRRELIFLYGLELGLLDGA